MSDTSAAQEMPKRRGLDPRVTSIQADGVELMSGCCIARSTTIDVSSDKPDTSSGARLELGCSNAAHFHSSSRPIDAMEVAPMTSFPLSHTSDHTGVTIRATISQGGYAPHQMEVVNVRICNDIMACPAKG